MPSQVSLACPLPFPPCLVLFSSSGPSGNILLRLRSSLAELGYSSLDLRRCSLLRRSLHKSRLLSRIYWTPIV